MHNIYLCYGKLFTVLPEMRHYFSVLTNIFKEINYTYFTPCLKCPNCVLILLLLTNVRGKMICFH